MGKVAQDNKLCNRSSHISWIKDLCQYLFKRCHIQLLFDMAWTSISEMKGWWHCLAAIHLSLLHPGDALEMTQRLHFSLWILIWQCVKMPLQYWAPCVGRQRVRRYGHLLIKLWKRFSLKHWWYTVFGCTLAGAREGDIKWKMVWGQVECLVTARISRVWFP